MNALKTGNIDEEDNIRCNLDGISCRCPSNAKRFCTKVLLFQVVSEGQFSCHATSRRVAMSLPVQ